MAEVWVCARCRARVAPGAPRCPECPSTEFNKTEDGMTLKIDGQGVVTDSAVPQELEGGTVPPGTVSEPAGESPEQADVEPQAPDAAPEPAPAPVPPRTPPRRASPPGT